jgi:CBS domain containing-hemolysin-like protein
LYKTMSEVSSTSLNQPSVPEQQEPDPPSEGDSWLQRVARVFRLSASETVKDRLERVLNSGEALKDFSEPELHMLRNLVGFSEVRVDDIMVPRGKILAVDGDGPLLELVRLLSGETSHSRLPVYRGSLDEPQGMIHIKDLMRWLAGQLGLQEGAGGTLRSLNLTNIDMSRSIASLGITRKVLYAAPSEPALRLLKRMQTERVHMALVADEFGAIDGLVTIEDLVEEVFGEIEDEHDSAREIVREVEDGIYIADARIPLDQLSARLGVSLTVPGDDAETLGGLILWMFGRLPSPKEHIGHPQGFDFEVMSVERHRIGKIRIRRADRSARGEPGGETSSKAA